MAARAFHHHLTPAERRAVPLMAASLAVLALGISDPTRHLHFDGTRLGIYLAALMVLATFFATAIDGRSAIPPLGWPRGSSTARSTARPRRSPTRRAPPDSTR